MSSTESVVTLPKQQLLGRFSELVSRERRCTAELLAAIAEIDERRLWAEHACPSMFAFCVERFHMSEPAAGKRIWAARTARRFPPILGMIVRGELHLSGLVRLAKHLTEENHHEVLRRARHKSLREIGLLVAELAPQPDVASRIRALPRRRPSAPGREPAIGDAPAMQRSSAHAPRKSSAPAMQRSSAHAPRKSSAPAAGAQSARCRGSAAASDSARQSTADSAPGSRPDPHHDPHHDSPHDPPHDSRPDPATNASSPARPPLAAGVADERRARQQAEHTTGRNGRVTPLAPRRYKLEMTIDQATHDKLRTLQDLLAHGNPAADPATIVSRAIELLLDDTLRKKAALTDRPQRGRPARAEEQTTDGRSNGSRTRTIPAAVRREVWLRDEGRCTFVDAHGRRCPSVRRVEYHHERPYALGGAHEADNLTLRCSAHNQHQADLDFGRSFMEARRRESSATFRAERCGRQLS